MSTATAKRHLAIARADVEAFRDLFPRSCYLNWQIAGSVRRQRPEVGDVEHVVIPAFGPDPANLFAPPTINLLWTRVQELAEQGVVSRHLYGTRPETGEAIWRWGEKYRGMDFRGFNHEIFTADADNFGAQLVIRTGPAEFSQMMVTRLRQRGRRNDGGYVWSCTPCTACRRDPLCKQCDGTGLVPATKLSVPDEPAYFEAAGVVYLPPEGRQ